MKAYFSFLPLFLALCYATGFAQSSRPSITIGTHVLTLGMSESTVLEQLGTDLSLQRVGNSGSDWTVAKKGDSVYRLMGSVYFDASHHLASAMRNWDVEDGSSKSLFYAFDAASKSVESDGLTSCHVYTTDKDASVEGGSIHVKNVVLDCDKKRISMILTISDAPSIASGIEVAEWLHGE